MRGLGSAFRMKSTQRKSHKNVTEGAKARGSLPRACPTYSLWFCEVINLFVVSASQEWGTLLRAAKHPSGNRKHIGSRCGETHKQAGGGGCGGPYLLLGLQLPVLQLLLCASHLVRAVFQFISQGLKQHTINT